MDQYQHQNASSSSNGASTMPEFQPLPASPDPEASGPTFTILDAPTPKLTVEPFTADEIVSGAGFMLVVGLRLQTERETQAFLDAFQWVVKPIFPTAKVVEQLKLGEALAHYGIGKSMAPGGGLDKLPPLVRIACGALALGVAGFMAHRAVQLERASAGEGVTQDDDTIAESSPVGMADRGPGPAGDSHE